jgi:hypothetical protein
MVTSNKAEKKTKSLAYVLAILLILAAISSVAIPAIHVLATTKPSKSNLTQLPSEPTDFPNNDQKAVETHVTSAKKDSIGSYHVIGEIKNLSNDTTLQFVKVTAHLYDGSGQPVAVTTCCYADPMDIEPGHTSTFDSFAQEDVISGTPTSYRLSFDWK